MKTARQFNGNGKSILRNRAFRGFALIMNEIGKNGGGALMKTSGNQIR